MPDWLHLDGAFARLGLEADCAADVSVLARLAARVRDQAGELLDAGASAAQVTALLSAVNDRITCRVLALTAHGFRLPPASWCWLAFGSEGRDEQTLVTDQDNGLIFSAADDGEAHALRERFLPFAAAVNQALASCGFRLCSGNIMAGNPAWCLSLDEWKQRFFNWIRTPDPEALLNASIFFDFRPLDGDTALADALAAHLTALAPGNDAFLRMMAANALAVEPPIGRLRDFVTEADTLDLKKFGSRLFVDAIRILALAHGITSAATSERLRLLAPRLHLPPATLADTLEAFHALQAFRLAAQRAAMDDVGNMDVAAANRLAPNSLGDYQRRRLLDALKQARQLQGLLKHSLRLDQ